MRTALTLLLALTASANAQLITQTLAPCDEYAHAPRTVRVVSSIPRTDHNPARPLATRPPAATPWHHTRTAPATGNGRLYQSNTIRRTPTPTSNTHGRGPESFGAPAETHATALAKVGTEVVAFDPWTRRHVSHIPDLDHARQVWLRERGYTGGVRTFVNPVSNNSGNQQSAPATPPASSRKPAGWFRRPTVLPRTKPTEQVRYSLPPGMNPRLAEKLRETESTATASR